MKTLKEQKWMIVVYGVILFTIGVTQFVLSIVNFSSAMNLMSYAVAVGLFVIGLMHIISSFIADTKSFFKASLVLGAIAVSCGVVFIVVPYILGSFIVYFVASLLLILSAIFIAKAIVGIVYKYKKSWIVTYFISATIGIVLGVLAFVYLEKSLAVTQVIYCVIAVALAAIGVAIFIFGIKALSKKDKEEEKPEEK